MTKQINVQEFQKQVIENMNLSLVQFKKEWSGACQIITPIYEELARSYKGVAEFFAVDIEKESGLDKRYGVMEVPTILFFKGGRIIDHAIGLIPRNLLISKIENAISRNITE